MDRHQEFDPPSNEMKRREISRRVILKPLKRMGVVGGFVVAAAQPQYLKSEQRLLLTIQTRNDNEYNRTKY